MPPIPDPAPPPMPRPPDPVPDPLGDPPSPMPPHPPVPEADNAGIVDPRHLPGEVDDPLALGPVVPLD